MPSKEKVLISITKDKYSRSEVSHLINSITHIQAQQEEIENNKQEIENFKIEHRKKSLPQYLKKGDTFVYKESIKPRPAVIIKVFKDTCVAITLSTTEDYMNLSPSKSRFFKDGFFSKHLITVRHEYVFENFCGVYDNPKHLNSAIREIKEYLNKVL